MLPSSKRLKKADFKTKNKEKTFGKGRFLTVTISKGHSLNGSRFAIIIPGSVTKSKPKRNTLRRRLYSLFIRDIQIPGTFNVVVYPKKEALMIDIKNLKEDLESVLKKLNLEK